MGIDVYARWRNQSEQEQKAQYTGFSVVAGDVGYLREAYHGGPYVTKFLMEEAFEPERFGLKDMAKLNKTGEIVPRDDVPDDLDWNEYETLGVQIPAAVLRERLPLAVLLAIYREAKVYGDGKMPEGFETHIEDGDAAKKLTDSLTRIFTQEVADNSHRFIASLFPRSDVDTIKELIAKRQLPGFALSFVDFVELCEKQEAEAKEPCWVYASY